MRNTSRLLPFTVSPAYSSSVIHSVTVASQPAEFVHNDPLVNLHISKPQDCHTHPELKRTVYSALADGDEGELSIGIPKDVVIKQSGNAVSGIISEGEYRSGICCGSPINRHKCAHYAIRISCHP